MKTKYDLDALREGYEPSASAKRSLKKSGLTVVGNEIAGSGKDALIRAIMSLKGSNFGFIPSRKTRGKRDGEVLGVDFVQISLDQAVKDVQKGRYIEWEPFRGTDINGTHLTELNKAIKSGFRPIKDVETRGQAVLRTLNPDLRCVYPLPDLEHWIRMLEIREGLENIGMRDFLAGHTLSTDLSEAPKDSHLTLVEEAKKREDLKKRMEVASLQWETVWNLGLHEEPNTLFIVNKFGDISNTAALSRLFIDEGPRIPHITSYKCMRGEQVLDYLGQAADIALSVIPAAA